MATASNSLSQALDREVARAHALLVGLESSPALHADNLQDFHKQLTETTFPEGARLTLSSKERVLLHSRFPFETPLPSLSDFTPQPAFLERIDTLEFSLTGRVQAAMLDATMVTVNMKVPNPNGEWRYFLTTVLSDQRFASIMKQHRNPSNLAGAIYDQNNNGIVSVRGEDVVVAPQMAGSVSTALSATPASIAMTGLIYADDPAGVPSLVAFNRSKFTQWTVTTSISCAEGLLVIQARPLALRARSRRTKDRCRIPGWQRAVSATGTAGPPRPGSNHWPTPWTRLHSASSVSARSARPVNDRGIGTPYFRVKGGLTHS